MHTRRFTHLTAFVLVVVLTASLAYSREPLSVDQGKTGLLLTLRKLRTTARLMHTAAHPDDEDGAMLTLESRGHGTFVVQMTLTRGEGGQNAVGRELGDELGMLRTLELLEADRYYGAEQRFSRVADFGFSRSAEETIQKWNGRETALADLVRVIRTLRPEVIISRFIGDPSDGHGNHQASGILTREAFRAAADPAKFPEQIKEGLQPFQAKKLYVRARGDDWNVELDVNHEDPLLGMSYVAWGWQGLKHQLSQGSANWQMPTRMRPSHYKLVDTTISNYRPRHESDFFDGIDTTLLALTNIAPNAALLKPGLLELTSLVDEAGGLADKDQKAAAVPLLRGLAKTKEMIEQAKNLPITPPELSELLVALETKRDQFRDAANLALGATLKATADLPAMKEVRDPAGQMWLAAVPEQTFKLAVSTVAHDFTMNQPELQLPNGSMVLGWGVSRMGPAVSFSTAVNVGTHASYTRQYWHRDDADREAIYRIDDPQYQTLPLTPWPFVARGTYEYRGLKGEVRSTVEVATPKPHPLITGPAWSILTPSSTLVISASTSAAGEVDTRLRSNLPTPWVLPELKLLDSGIAQVAPPPNGDVLEGGRKPADQVEKRFTFQVTNAAQRRFTLRTIAESEKKTFDVGYSVVTRDDLGTAYYFRRATQPVSIVDVKVPRNLRVGYVMGVGDDIPGVLKSIGVKVTLIAPSTLPTADLGQFDTIVLGIRSYESQADLRANNQRLLDFAKNGGTLMVQYIYDTEQFIEGHFAPYPLTLDRNNQDRVVNEEAPVTILAPQSPVFRTPNPISTRDFDGWVQERALYSPTAWDSHYESLLLSQDSDGPPIKGGLLVAAYGKGTYIWNSWAFFRQLPAGVSGAIRLYVNLLAAHGSATQ
jgi:LmbE family N-acetylglucosaminyl deacetylase